MLSVLVQPISIVVVLYQCYSWCLGQKLSAQRDVSYDWLPIGLISLVILISDGCEQWVSSICIVIIASYNNTKWSFVTFEFNSRRSSPSSFKLI